MDATTPSNHNFSCMSALRMIWVSNSSVQNGQTIAFFLAFTLFAGGSLAVASLALLSCFRATDSPIGVASH